MSESKQEKDYLVTVCDRCLRASCWHYTFPCDQARSAGTKRVRASELRVLDLEHPSNYSREQLVRFGDRGETE